MVANPSLHLTGYSGLRPLPPAGELQRWAQFMVFLRRSVLNSATAPGERVLRNVSVAKPRALPAQSASRVAPSPLRRSRSGGSAAATLRLCAPRPPRAARPSAVGAPPSGAISARSIRSLARQRLCSAPALPVKLRLRGASSRHFVHQPAGNAGLPNPAFNTDVLQPASPASARRLTPSR